MRWLVPDLTPSIRVLGWESGTRQISVLSLKLLSNEPIKLRKVSIVVAACRMENGHGEAGTGVSALGSSRRSIPVPVRSGTRSGTVDWILGNLARRSLRESGSN
jgi:hypothetical protein